MSCQRFPRQSISMGLAVVLVLAFGQGACRAGFVRESRISEPEKDTQKVEPEKAEKNDEIPKQEIGEVEKPENVETTSTRDGSGKLVRVQIYGDELIREEVDVGGIPVKRTTLRGNAIVLHNNVRISAPLIVLSAGKTGQCIGGVRIDDVANGLSIFAERGDYDREAQTIVLSGSPRMQSDGKGRKPVHLTAGKMVRNMGTRISTLDGDVRIATDGWTILGDHARFEDQGKRIDIPDQPIVFGAGQFLSGKTMSYYTEEKKIVYQDEIINIRQEEVSATPTPVNDSLEAFIRRGDHASGFVDISGPGVLTADQIVHDFSNREEPITTVRGNVLFTREGLRIAAPMLESAGKSGARLIAREGVDSTDRKQNLHITAGRMLFEREVKLLHLEQDPKIEFLKKDSDVVTGSLSGAQIERNFDTKQTVARGGVKLVQSDVTAVGQKAVYQEDSGAIVLEGEPGIQQENGFLKCEKIVYYPEKRRLILMNRLRGQLARD
ncbi:MAG: hypothetical protein K8S54_19160 [Spirochaetia bacterium]|nr:hypothetical protein [Spirochaetia bacterium]